MDIQYDLLEMIAPPKESWKIHVRVIRLWSLPKFKDPKSSSSIEMVLMNEQGTTMHASVGEDLISVFESSISEGTVYVFTYFGVNNNCGLYRTTSHQFRLFFQDRTTVLPSFCDAIPLHGIKLVPFREIMGYSPHHPFLVDVAGVMAGVEGERKYMNDDKLINMMVIHIENDGLRLNIIVLGEMVDRIKNFLASGDQQLPIVIFQFARVKNAGGTNIVQNIMYGTRLLINPDIPEALMLRKSVYYREISQYMSVVSGKPAYLDEDEVLYSIGRKTIKELRAAADVGFYIVRATVLDVEPVPSWWYKSCVCSVKAEANADEYFCDGYNRDVNNVVDRYKLNLLVFDGTGTTNFVVFDKEVAALFGRICTEMVKELNEKGKASKDPTGFNEFFLDKEFLFKVEVETTGWCDTYDVSVIRSDSTNLPRWRDTQGPVKSGVPRAGPINPMHPRGEDGCFVCDESPDPIVKNLSVIKRPVVRRLLDEFNMSGAPSIKK
ncbi:replication protein A 70 kDa DNA-binding subunit D [Arachis hypogaea]|uniref:replication protein A 70 kDa DNA-binding subunit D n=2 Tax=Arachis TaxID=3817 RepID=UPI003B217696